VCVCVKLINSNFQYKPRRETSNIFKQFLGIGMIYLHKGGPGSSVGKATDYGLDGPGIESRQRRDFSHTSRPEVGAHPASCTVGTGSFPGLKRSGRGADHPPLTSAEVENE
jgi:hypothetical protein